MNSSKKRFVLIASTVGAVLVGGSIAIAYWTTTGSGTDTAGVGTDTPVTVTQDSNVSGLVPGGPAADLDFTVTSTADGPQRISDVSRIDLQCDAGRRSRWPLHCRGLQPGSAQQAVRRNTGLHPGQ